jgi:C-terminal processing protease CtpA/Prc
MSLYVPQCALSANIIALKGETPHVDYKTAGHSRNAKPAEIQPLQGQVSQDQSQESADQDHTELKGGANSEQTNLGALTPASDSDAPYKLAIQKLQSGVKLSADDYRNLGIGTLGYEENRTYFQDRAEIEMVYKGSPAEAAGIQVGDVIIDSQHDDSKIDDPTVPRWAIRLAKAGTTAQVALMRHGKITMLSLTRVNIEDLPDTKMRHLWERIIDNLGHPPDGEYMIPKPDGN